MNQPLDLTELTLKVRMAAPPGRADEAAEANSAKKTTPMDRRSWYMPRANAEALAALIEDLHYETRRPKHEVLAAVVAAALGQKEAVRQRLEDGG